MSIKKRIKTNLINKHDTEENWLKATGFIPEKGQIIIYDPDINHNYARYKIGDGVLNAETGKVEGTNINNLPFVNGMRKEEADELYAPKDTVETLDNKVENLETNLTATKTATGNLIILEDLPENATVNIVNPDVVPVFVSSGKAIEWLDWDLGSCIIHENNNIISTPVDYNWNGPSTYGQAIDNTPGAINRVLITETVLPITANYTNIEIEATAGITIYCIIQSDPNSEPEQIDSMGIDLTDITAVVNGNTLSIYGTFTTPEPWLEGGRIAGSEGSILYTLDKLNLSTTGAFEDYKFVSDFGKLTNYPVFSPITSIIGRYSSLTVEHPDIANISNYATKEHVNEIDNRLTTNINDVDSNSRDRDTYLDDKNTELEGKIQKTNTELSTKIQETNEQLSTEIKELEKHTLNLLPHNTVNGNSIFVNDVSPSEHNLDITLTDSDAGTFIAVSSEEIQTITARDNYLDIYGYGKWAQLDYLDKVQYIATTGYGSDRPAFGGNYPDGEDYFLSLAIADEICDIKYYKVELDDEGNSHKTEQVIDRPTDGYWLDYYVDDQYPIYESGEAGLFCADIVSYPSFVSVSGDAGIDASYHGEEDIQVEGAVSYTGWDIDYRNFPITLALTCTAELPAIPEGSEFVIAYYYIGQNFTITVGDNNKITIPETKIYTSSTNVKSIAPNMCVATNYPNTTITCTYNQDMSKVFVKQESIAPLMVTTGEDGLATHSPTEMLEHIRNGGSVYYNNLSLTYLDENHAQFDFIDDDGVCGTNFIYADKSEEYFEYPIGSQPPLIVKIENGLSTHTPAEIFDYVKSGGSVFYWADAAADEVNDLLALSQATPSYAIFDKVTDDGFVESLFVYGDKSIKVFEYDINTGSVSEVLENDYCITYNDDEGVVIGSKMTLMAGIHLDDCEITGIWVDEEDPTCAVNKAYVDRLGVIQEVDGKTYAYMIEPLHLENGLNVEGNRIHGVSGPTDDMDAANKEYVDTAIANIYNEDILYLLDSGSAADEII